MLSLVVLVGAHISLKNIVKWSQETLKALSIKRDEFAIFLSSNVGSTRLVTEECKLSKVVTWLVLHHGLALVGVEENLSLSFNENEELLAVVSLVDDDLTLDSLHLLDGISQL